MASVGQVIGQLRNLGIRNAQPLYEYLAQALPVAEAEPRLRAHPAAYSGVLLQNDADFQRAARELRAAPCERPVVLVSRAFLQHPTANLADSLAVVLPRETGLWNIEQAAKDAPALRERVEQASRRRAEIESEIAEWTDTSSCLRNLTQRFTEGRVSALRENVRTLATAIEDLRASAGRVEEDLKGAKSRRAHAEGEVQKVTTAKQAAASKRQRAEQAWQTHEQPRPEWERRVRELDDQAEAATRNCAEMDLERDDLERQADGLEPLIRAEQQGATRWAERIAQLPADYYDATAKPQLKETLDALAELFTTKRSVFEKTFSATAATGQLTELSKVNGTLKAEFRIASAGLDRVEIEYMAIEDRLPALIVQSNSELVETKAAHKAAEQRTQDLRNRLSATKRCTDLPEGRREPETVSEVEAMGREFRDKQEEALARAKDLSEELHAQDLRISELGGSIPRYVSMLQMLEQARTRLDDDEAGHLGFTGSGDQDQALIGRIAEQRTRLRRDIGKESDAVREVFQERVHARAAQMAKDDRPAILDKYLAFSLGDVEQKIDERIHEIGQALEAARGELASIEQDRTIIVAQLDQRASVAERRLSDLERASKMPAGIEAWAGRPFISVRVPAAHDATERRQRLTQLLNTWIRSAGEKIPDGVALAYAALMVVLGDRSITMKILKPEYRLQSTTYDIADLHKFSGGEKVTAAIILYAVLVRYRARQRGEVDLLGSDAGFLLLDNPFGQVTLLELIDVQVRTARMMGLQLIFATGVADFNALGPFPHRVMLRNTGVNLRTGDRYIGHDPNPPTAETHRIEGAVLGERFAAAKQDADIASDEDQDD